MKNALYSGVSIVLAIALAGVSIENSEAKENVIFFQSQGLAKFPTQLRDTTKLH